MISIILSTLKGVRFAWEKNGKLPNVTPGGAGDAIVGTGEGFGGEPTVGALTDFVEA